MGEIEKAVVTTQPLAQDEPTVWNSSSSSSQANQPADAELPKREPGVAGYVKFLATRDAWIGDYDFKSLCMPRLNPWKRISSTTPSTPFYGLHDDLPIALAAICGLQHALAMLGGLITPPIIISNAIKLPSEMQSYLISASLITSGILSLVQQSAIRLPFNRQLGSGLLSVVGTSFATLSTATAIFENLYREGTCPLNPDGTKASCPEAYGYLLGTAAVCALLEVFLSFLPPRVLRRMFPPMITGVVVMLIGFKLIGESAIPAFGGGSSCRGTETLCPLPNAYEWGDRRYLGLGFLSFITIILVEMFGSPAMRSASVALGLLLPLIVAGPLNYISRADIDSARAITFLWVETFPLKVYGPAVLPLMAVYISLMMEAIGDTTATCEVSKIEVEGEEYDRRIGGAVLSDGLGGIVSALFTITPMSVFAQNNGVIAITRCANRNAGRWCSFWLILFGIIGKLAGCVLAIPDPILGGVLLFLFASIGVAGLRILSMVRFTRRVRFVLAVAFAFGFGSLLIKDWWSSLFNYTGTNKALRGFLDSIVIVLSTPFLISALAGMIANGILPLDEEDLVDERESLTKASDEEEANDKPPARA